MVGMVAKPIHSADGKCVRNFAVGDVLPNDHVNIVVAAKSGNSSAL